MNSTAFLINTSRGEVIDEKALYNALRNGTIAGAALDVFENEPAVHPLLPTLDNVVLTPHIASASVDTRRAMTSPRHKTTPRSAMSRPAPTSPSTTPPTVKKN